MRFTSSGRPRRVTWFQGQGDVDAAAAAMLGTGGIDLDPERGSPAALRAERIGRHPQRYAAVAVAGGIAKVGIPLLFGLLGLRLILSLQWPDLPSVPWPDWNLPSIPWPDLDLPDWMTSAWVTWLADHPRYLSTILTILLAAIYAGEEIKRGRQQDALKAELKAEASSDDTNQPASPSVGSHPHGSHPPLR